MNQLDIIDEIVLERFRQKKLNANPLNRRLRQDIADPVTADGYRLAVLVEEVGEVANQLNETTATLTGTDNRHSMKVELIQVAAVCVAWLEALE